jgi:hypothetical protein
LVNGLGNTCVISVNGVVSIKHLPGAISRDFLDDGLSHPRFPHVGVEYVPLIVECESALNLAGPFFAPIGLSLDWSVGAFFSSLNCP